MENKFFQFRQFRQNFFCSDYCCLLLVFSRLLPFRSSFFVCASFCQRMCVWYVVRSDEATEKMENLMNIIDIEWYYALAHCNRSFWLRQQEREKTTTFSFRILVLHCEWISRLSTTVNRIIWITHRAYTQHVLWMDYWCSQSIAHNVPYTDTRISISDDKLNFREVKSIFCHWKFWKPRIRTKTCWLIGLSSWEFDFIVRITRWTLSRHEL